MKRRASFVARLTAPVLSKFLCLSIYQNPDQLHQVLIVYAPKRPRWERIAFKTSNGRGLKHATALRALGKTIMLEAC